MAIILCPIHGESDVASVSDLVAKAVLEGAPRPKMVHVVLKWGGEMEESVHEVDASAAESLRSAGLLSDDSLTVESFDTSFEVVCRLKVVCAQCLAEARARWDDEASEPR